MSFIAESSWQLVDVSLELDVQYQQLILIELSLL